MSGNQPYSRALTLAKVDIANYPFCTIDPNIGVAFIPLRFDCPCKSLRERLEADGKIGPVTTDDPEGAVFVRQEREHVENFEG